MQADIGIVKLKVSAALLGDKMRILSTIIIFLCALASAFSTQREQGWHGIRPLHATRTDVEKLIGAPMESNGITYDLKDERVNFVYSGSPCAKGWPYGYNVPRNTVISIVTYPKAKRSLSDLQINLDNYKRTDRPENQRVIYYNDEDGITIETDSSRQEIISIQYLPVSGDKYLRCPDAAAREASIEKGESAYLTPVVYYVDVSPHEQHVRLDYFVDRLKQAPPKSVVYIIGYADKIACSDDSWRRALWAKRYLVKTWKISSARIRLMDGGHRHDISIELFIVGAGGPKPLSSPNIHPASVQLTSNCGRHRKRV